MRIRAGYDIAFTMSQHTPMILMLTVHPSRGKDVLTAQKLLTAPKLPLREYRDVFGNRCTRFMTPAGTIRLSGHSVVEIEGVEDPINAYAQQVPIEQIGYVLPSLLLPLYRKVPT